MELTYYETYEYKLLKIAAQLKYGKMDEDDGEDENDEKDDSPYQPFETDKNFDRSKFINPSKEEIVRILGRKFRRQLSLLKPFVDILKYKTSAKYVSICPLSCTSKLWNILYNSEKRVSNLLHRSQKVGLLYCTNSEYRFAADYEDMNYCKSYAYNKDVEKKLLELFKEQDAKYHCESANTSYVLSIIERFKKTMAKNEEMRRKYDAYTENHVIRITQQANLTFPKELLMHGLVETYPQFMEMLHTIDKDNGTMEISDWDYAVPTFKYRKDGRCCRIGLRKTNQYCNLKVHNISWETLSEQEKRRTRNEVIRQKLGAVNENDVKSSIYRITYLLNYGEWLDRSYDFYPMMAGFDMTTGERDLYKAPLAMKLYFSPSVKKTIANSTYRREETAELFEKIGAQGIFAEARERMFDVIGPSYRSEIFLHESCIYTQVAHRIRDMGFKLLQIYDGFFTDKVLDESAFDEIVKECAIEYYEKWNGYWYKWE